MKKIMIVDDDVQITTLLKKFLTAEGYEVIIINQSSEVIQAANSIHPDLLVLDLMMPDPDGFVLCRMLRADPNFTHMPILIVSALDDNDSKAMAFGAKANDYLTKPINLDKLTLTIEELLEKAGLV